VAPYASVGPCIYASVGPVRPLSDTPDSDPYPTDPYRACRAPWPQRARHAPFSNVIGTDATTVADTDATTVASSIVGPTVGKLACEGVACEDNA